MRGLEFVRDKQTKEPFRPERQFHQAFYNAARKEGLLVLSSSGSDRGHGGDMALIGPPLTISRAQIDELVDMLAGALALLEKEID